MSFNFGSLAETKPASTISYLKPYTINDNVTISEVNTKSGDTKDGRKWKSLEIVYKNDEGVYRDSIFYLDENNPRDWERQEVEMSNGGKRMRPSSWENLKNKMASIGFAFFPDDFAKLQQVSGKVKSFEELMEYFKKMVEKNIGKVATSMKLVGRTSDGRVYATLPNCTGIAQATTAERAASNGVNVGDWYTWMISPFGNNLTFSDYEQGKANEYHNAKPTPASDLVVDNGIDSTDSEDDLASLLKDL